jgi:hypothetical protein
MHKAFSKFIQLRTILEPGDNTAAPHQPRVITLGRRTNPLFAAFAESAVFAYISPEKGPLGAWPISLSETE